VTWEGVYGGGGDGTGHTGRSTTAPQLASAYQVLHLREGAPRERIEAARRVLARRYHPDLGGTDEAMQQINGADLLLKRIS